MTVSELPAEARCVVIGAGIVGNCLVGHLAKLGWTDLVPAGQGPAAQSGGSTATPPTSSSRGSQQGDVPAGRAERQPVPRSRLVGGFRRHRGGPHARADGRVPTAHDLGDRVGRRGVPAQPRRSGRTGSLRQHRHRAGASTARPSRSWTPSRTGYEDAPPGRRCRLRGVRQHRGARHSRQRTVPCPACGPWNRSSPTRARSAPTTWSLPAACGRTGWPHGRCLHPARAGGAQMAASALDVLAETNNEIGYPIVRDMDTFCYERQSAGSMEVGSYAHRPILHHPDDIPSNVERPLSPTEMPFTPDDFDVPMEEAIELMDMLGDAELKYAITACSRSRLTPCPASARSPRCATCGRRLPSGSRRGRDGTGGGRVDDPRLPAGHRRPRLRRGPLLRRRAQRHPHLGTSSEHFTRRTASSIPPSSGQPPQPARRPLFLAPAGPRRRVLPGPHLGAATVVRLQRRPRGALRPRGPRGGVGRRWWSPITMGEHLNLRPELRAGGPQRLPDLRVVRPGCGGLRRPAWR